MNLIQSTCMYSVSLRRTVSPSSSYRFMPQFYLWSYLQNMDILPMIEFISISMETCACFQLQSIKFLCKPDPDWGPAKKEHQTERRALDHFPVEALESSTPLTGVGLTSIGMKPISPDNNAADV